jgi:hypothetical protein
MIAQRMGDAACAHNQHIARFQAFEIAMSHHSAPQRAAQHQHDQRDERREPHGDARNPEPAHHVERAAQQQRRDEHGLNRHALLMQTAAILRRPVEPVRAREHHDEQSK